LKFARLTLACSLGFLVALSGCKRSQNASTASSAPQPAYTQVDPATAGVISGSVTFDGKSPERLKIDMAQDPACELSLGDNYAEQYVIHAGKLANVFVYIKSGLGDQKFVPPQKPVVLDQRGCRYIPHVIGVMAGQPVEIRNSDPTMHNVHPAPTAPDNREWDISEGPHGNPVTRTFDAPEIMLPVRCNNHPWMQAFINVTTNPFYAVSDANGNFEIKGLPPGTYTIAAVHETMGEQDATVTVTPHGTATTAFAYKASMVPAR
jgi:hypothetical protein